MLAATLAASPLVSHADSTAEVIPIDGTTGSLAAAATDDMSWSSAPAGWSFARTYRAGTQDFLVLVRAHTGEIEIRNLGTGTIDGISQRYHLNRRYSAVDVVRIGSTPYLFLLDADAGYLRSYTLTSSGTLTNASATTNAAFEGKELLRAFTVGGQGRLFAYDRWTGSYVVYSTAGALIDSGTWTRGWTSADFMTLGGTTYRLLYKAADEPGNQGGRMQIVEIDEDFDALVTIHNSYHADDWTKVRFVTTPGVGGDTFISFYNAATGRHSTRSFDGTVGGVQVDETIDPGWNDSSVFSVGSTNYAMMLSETGVVPLGTNQIDAFVASVRGALTTPCASGNCVAGYQLALTENGRVVFHEAGGVRNANTGTAVTPSTTFTLGSVSKTITSTTVLRMVDWGEVDLDGPLVHYFDYDDAYDFEDFDPSIRYITVRDALEHTVGLDDSLGSCDEDNATAPEDCTAYLSNPRTVSCADDPNIDDPEALLCGRTYENENTSLLRSVIEAELGSQGMQPVVDITRELWMDDSRIQGRTCAATSSDSDRHSGIPFNVTLSADNTGCANGGWKLSALDVAELMWLLRYEQILGPELTADLLTNTPGSDLIWDRFSGVGTISTLAYKNGATSGVQNQMGMEVAGNNRQVDVVLLTNTSSATGVSARTTLNAGFAAMGAP